MKLNLDLKALEWAAVAGAWSAGAFNCFVPNALELRRLSPDDLDGVRAGYQTAVIQSLLVGGLISLAAETPLPIVAALLTDAVMVTSYESHIPQQLRLGAASCLACR